MRSVNTVETQVLRLYCVRSLFDCSCLYDERCDEVIAKRAEESDIAVDCFASKERQLAMTQLLSASFTAILTRG